MDADELIRALRERGIGERVLAAMARVPRDGFVPQELRDQAWENEALPIGSGQTISQPVIVALICEGLRLEGDERVLDVGTGSGYQAAVLAELAAEVVTIETLPELAGQARLTLAEAGYGRVDCRIGDGSLGVPDRAPYDGIAVAAAAPRVPPALVAQLRPGGRLVVPVGPRRSQQLVVAVMEEGRLRIESSVPCRFVPLVGDAGYRQRW